MSKFKIGDRVAVYGHDYNLNAVRVVATVDGINSDGLLSLIDGAHKPGSYDHSLAHPMQCRKLKKKRKLPLGLPEEIWLPTNRDAYATKFSSVKAMLSWLEVEPLDATGARYVRSDK